MVKLILSLLLAIVVSLPGYTRETKPYLAVFCNPGAEEVWYGFNPDLIVIAKDWGEFDKFLLTARKEAHGRPIEMDITVHGDEHLMLVYDDIRTRQQVVKSTTMGFIVNHIERILSKQDVTLILEACYSGHVYKSTIRGNDLGMGENCNHVPKFPIYGGSYNHPNINNLIYIQYKTKIHRFFEDLRIYEVTEGNPNKDEDENSKDVAIMIQLYRILAPLYCP